MGGSYPFGLFSWTDITTPDVAGAKEFYSGLFGWEAEDQFDPDGNYVYTMFRIDGKDAAGLGAHTPEMLEQGVPPIWNSYVTVASVDDTVAAAKAAGGSVVVEPMDVFTSGRMAFLADPHGAMFAVWESWDTRGAEVFNVHGALNWNELATPDMEASKKFYGDVLGWDFEAYPGDIPYWLVVMDNKIDGDGTQDDKYNGGIMPLSRLPEGTPPFWGVYFAVDDADAIIARAEELGGGALMPAMDTPAGRIGVVRDPQGGVFTIIETQQQ